MVDWRWTMSGARVGHLQKGNRKMKSRVVLVAVGVLVVLAVVASLSIAAAPKSYQFTGTVTDFDAKDKRIAVDKDGDI